MQRCMILWLLLGLGLVMGRSPAWAFVPYSVEVNGRLVGARWPAGQTDVPFVVNRRSLDLLPDLPANSAPLASIEAALETWSVGSLQPFFAGPTSTGDVGRDGRNLITFADTPRNRDAVGDGTGTAVVWLVQRGGQILIEEADVLVNPEFPLATDGRETAIDIQSIVTSLLGTALGLSSSPIGAATMFPYNEPGLVHKRSLHTDDVAGMRHVYGTPDPKNGSIAGTVVSTGGAPVFAGHVVAVHLDGIVWVGALTARDGSFTLPSLAPGAYQVYVEPLDGPVLPSLVSLLLRNVSQRFQTTFSGGNRKPASIQVSAGTTTRIEPIQVVAETPAINPDKIGWSDSGYGFADVAERNLTLAAGQTAFVAIAGYGIETVPRPGFSVSGNDIILHSGHALRTLTTGGPPAIIFPLTVRPGAPPGARSVYVDNGTERAVFTGCIEVVP
jgi:hypothetical protein